MPADGRAQFRVEAAVRHDCSARAAMVELMDHAYNLP